MPSGTCRQIVAVVASVAGCAVLAAAAGVVFYWATERAFR